MGGYRKRTGTNGKGLGYIEVDCALLAAIKSCNLPKGRAKAALCIADSSTEWVEWDPGNKHCSVGSVSQTVKCHASFLKAWLPLKLIAKRLISNQEGRRILAQIWSQHY